MPGLKHADHAQPSPSKNTRLNAEKASLLSTRMGRQTRTATASATARALTLSNQNKS